MPGLRYWYKQDRTFKRPIELAYLCITKSCEQTVSFDAGDMTNVGQTTFLWMKNVVEILEELGAPLAHVFFSQGCVPVAPSAHNSSGVQIASSHRTFV